MNATTPYAWHHTDLGRAGFIFAEGAIRTSRINPFQCRCPLPPEAAPVVWLTSDHRGDRTAAAHPRTGDEQRRPPAVRLAVPWDRMLAPADLVGTHGWTMERVDEDARRGRMHDMDPSVWRVHVGAIAVDDLARMQVLIRQQWRDLRPDDVELGQWREIGLRVRCYGVDMAVVPFESSEEGGRRGYLVKFEPDAVEARA